MPPPPGPGAALRAGTGLATALVVLAALAIPARAAPVPGYGAGIFAVDGASVATFSLADGGTYYLGVATDDPSSSVHAKVSYNGTLAAEINASGSAANLVSLAPGGYSIALEGHGRAALGWDFTDGTVQNFPDNAKVTAFLRPASPRLLVTVSLGNAQEIHLEVYDDHLLPVASTNVTTSGGVSVDLPSTRATAAYLVASVVLGNPQGVFGLAWSSPSPAAPGSGLGSQLLVAGLWVGVPIVIVLFLILAVRRRRGGMR